jgi:hypothetical protein
MTLFKRALAGLTVAVVASFTLTAPATAAPPDIHRAVDTLDPADPALAGLGPAQLRAPVAPPVPKKSATDRVLKGEGKAKLAKGNPGKIRGGKGVAAVPSQSLFTTTYYYNRGFQDTSAFGTLPTGVYASWGWGAAAPSFNSTNDSHTLFQIVASKNIGGNDNHVEVGARDDGSGLEIFTYHWVNGVPQGYNTNFTVVGTPTYAPGTAVSPASGALRFWVQYTAGDWWIAVYPNAGAFQWIGYFDDANWTGNGVNGFTDTTFPQAFTEIASNEATYSDVCSSMGSNTLATNLAGSSWGSVTYPGLSSTLVSITWGESPAGIHTYWNAEGLSARSARLGGPGDTGC